jgi:hypothetical protein
MSQPDITASDDAASRSEEQTEVSPSVANEPVAFDAAETRADDMRETFESWLSELRELAEEASASEAFRAWLDVQSRFHDYSTRNALLIACQRPDATRVAGYRTWQEEFDRQVREGEQAIWIWAPIIARRCPACEQSHRYHESSGCDYDATPPEAWSKAAVGFKPVPVFDVAQTEGEPLPALETAASGDGAKLLERLLDAAGAWASTVRIVPADEWTHGEAAGVCRWPTSDDAQPQIELRQRSSEAAMAGTLLHELAHARLHADDAAERPKREVEAEAVAYVVGRHFGLDTSNSAFYLAAWQDDETDVLEERLTRINRTAAALIEAVDG